MRKKIFFLVSLLIIILPYVSAGVLDTCKQNNLSCLNIFVDIEPYNYNEFFVASDSIYFNITFKNEYENQDINDILIIKLLSPSGNVIYTENYGLELKPNTTDNVISKGGLEGEKSAILLNTIGTYTLIVESKNYYFYENLQGGRWIRHTNEFSYSFDTMPKWQYDLWKSEKNIDEETISIMKEVNTNLEDTADSSTKMYNATIALLIFGAIQLLFIISQISSSRIMRKAFFNIVWILILILFLIFLCVGLIFSMKSNTLSLAMKIATFAGVLILIIFIMSNFRIIQKSMKSIQTD